MKTYFNILDQRFLFASPIILPSINSRVLKHLTVGEKDCEELLTRPISFLAIATPFSISFMVPKDRKVVAVEVQPI